jgi:hypothetical protein
VTDPNHIDMIRQNVPVLEQHFVNLRAWLKSDYDRHGYSPEASHTTAQTLAMNALALRGDNRATRNVIATTTGVPVQYLPAEFDAPINARNSAAQNIVKATWHIVRERHVRDAIS